MLQKVMRVKNYANINSSIYGMVIVVTVYTAKIICLQILHNNMYLKLMLRSTVPFPLSHMYARVHTVVHVGRTLFNWGVI
jgi:hypothetical protein